jgi:hypothetical protein
MWSSITISRAGLCAQARPAGQQGLGVGVLRAGEDLATSPCSRTAVAHHHHLVGDLADHAQVVADEQHAHAVLALHLGDQLQDLALDGHVQRRGRLVGDQQLGLAGQRHRDHHALLLAAGQLVRIGAQAPLRLGHADFGQQLLGALQRLACATAQVLDQRLAQLRPMVNTGFSEVIGSWKTQAMSLPRSACSSGSGMPSRSGPATGCALRSALSGSRFRIDIAVTLLPEPDSPTSATVAVLGMSKLMPLTAWARARPALAHAEGDLQVLDAEQEGGVHS